MNRLSDLEILLKVVDLGSFSAAARALGLTPSAVGKRIAHLEGRLGTSLLMRSTRRMSPTAAGRHFAEEAREILARLDALEEDVMAGASRLRGLVRVTAPNAFGRLHVTPAVVAFMKAHPEVEIELDLTDRTVDLVAEGIDIAIRTGRPVSSGLIGRRLTGYRRAICASPTYLASRGRPESPADLAHYRCLKLARENRPADWGLPTAEAPAARLGPGFRCNALDALRAACLDGEGVACLPVFLCGGDIRSGRLETLMEHRMRQNAVGDIMLLRPETVAVPRRVRELIDFLVRELKNVATDI